jgi:reactive intermediate/imine deaminase
MQKEVFIPRMWKGPSAPYSYAVKKGNMVFVAGQVPLNNKGKLVGKGDIKTQTKQVLENVQACLEGAGANLRDVVYTQVFLTDVSTCEAMNEVYREYFPNDFPARITTIAGLVKQEYLVEIGAIAITG